MSSKRLQRIRRLGVVIRQQEIPYLVIQGVVKTALALECITLAKSSRLEQMLNDFIVPAQACLDWKPQ